LYNYIYNSKYQHLYTLIQLISDGTRNHALYCVRNASRALNKVDIGRMAVVFSVSCTVNLRKLMDENRISPSHALKIGAYKLLGIPFEPEAGVSIQETDLGKAKRMQTTMQGAINAIEEEKEALQAKLDVLEKERDQR